MKTAAKQQEGKPLLLLSLMVIPLLINPGVVLSFDEVFLYPRLWWLYGVVLPSCVLLLWHCLCSLSPNLRGQARRLGIVVSLWIGWLVLSTIANKSGWPGWWGMPDRADGVLMHGLYGLLLVCGWCWAKQSDAWQRQFASAVLLGGGLLALSSVLQQLHLMGVPGDGAFQGVWATPFGGTLGNRGYMGGAMAMLLPLGLWGLGQYRDTPHLLRWAVLANSLIVWALLGSQTRGAWLAGLGGVAVWWWLSRRTRPKGWKTSLLAGAVLFTLTANLFVNSRTFGAGEAGLLNSSGRTVLWNSALVGIQQKPLLGWGTPGLYRVMNTRSAEELFQESGLQGERTSDFLNKQPDEPPAIRFRDLQGKIQFLPLNIDKVHNEYLDYALTYGLPAALFFLALLLTAIWKSAWTSPGLCGALVGYALYLMTWPDVIRFAPIAWFVLGIALAQHPGRTQSLPSSPALQSPNH